MSCRKCRNRSFIVFMVLLQGQTASPGWRANASKGGRFVPPAAFGDNAYAGEEPSIGFFGRPAVFDLSAQLKPEVEFIAHSAGIPLASSCVRAR